jgi:hypothetical protein
MKAFTKLFLVFSVICFLSCKKDKTTSPTPEPDVPKGTLRIDFSNMVDNAALVFNTDYLNPLGDTFRVTKFNYYISNIVLKKDDNSLFAVPNSYYVIKQSNSSQSIVLTGLPIASYKSIQFMLGVDSTRNISGAQSGALDPAIEPDMYWSWNTGYIFLKLEGTAPKSTAGDKTIEYHIGGYGGANKTQRIFQLDFGNVAIKVAETITPFLTLKVNVNEIFKSPNMIDFVAMPSVVSTGKNAKSIADNYSDMISIKSIFNP